MIGEGPVFVSPSANFSTAPDEGFLHLTVDSDAIRPGIPI
jgi:hypothetical protein